MSAGGGCEAAVTARTSCWWIKFKERGMSFLLGLKRAVYKRHVSPAILCGSKAWCEKESEMGRSIVRVICGVQLKDRNRSKDLIVVLRLDEIIHPLAMASSVRWYGHVLRREDGYVLRRALKFEVEGQSRQKKDMGEVG